MFKTIKRYPNYEISENGDIRKIGTDKIMKTYSVNGHKKIAFSHRGKTEYVSRLVAETYISNPEDKKVVRHLDGNLENDSVTNLEWADKSTTQRDSYLLGVDAPGGNEPSKRIQVVETGDIFPSIKACARAINGSPSGIRQCLNKEITNHKGFTFKLLP